MRRTLLLVSLAALLGPTAWAPAAHADPEMEVLVCDGYLAWGAFSSPYTHSTTNHIACTHEHVGTTTTRTPDTWYDGPAESFVNNYAWAVPGIYSTVGSLSFTVSGTQWVVTFDEIGYGGFIPLGLSDADLVQSYGTEPDYHIRAGWIDNFPQATDVDAHKFYFVADYAYDV